MDEKCQWMFDDGTLCDLDAVADIKVPIALGAQGVLNLCAKHKAIVNQRNAQLRTDRKR